MAARRGNQRLSPKRELFVNNYLANGGNGTKAAAEAGFKHPRQQGSRLLTFVDIQERIKQRVDDACGLTSLEVIGTLTSQMRADITDLLDSEGKPDFKTTKHGVWVICLRAYPPNVLLTPRGRKSRLHVLNFIRRKRQQHSSVEYWQSRMRLVMRKSRPGHVRES